MDSQSAMTKLLIDEALEILSNRYRREILRLLTSRERYAFELAKILNISQRAVKKHLEFLQNVGLVVTQKRKSSKGPEREYYNLHQSVIVSLTVAPNLFLAAVRPLRDPSKVDLPITPSLQLGVPKNASYVDVIREGLNLLPQIQEGLDLLQVQQSKLLRGYQGLQAHISEYLEKDNFTVIEIRIIILLIENDGEIMQNILEKEFGDLSSITKEINNLKERQIINTQLIEIQESLNTKFELKLK